MTGEYGPQLAFAAHADEEPVGTAGYHYYSHPDSGRSLRPWISPQSPIGQDLANRLLPPSAAHFMGTDELGRDIFSRVIHGSRITLLIVGLMAVISAPLGLLAGARILLSR